MQYFKDWKYDIMISNDSKFRNRIKLLEIENDRLRTDVKDYDEWEKKTLDELNGLKYQLDALTNLNRILRSQVKPTEFKKANIMYEWKSNQLVKLRDTLQNFSNDEEYLSKYVGFCDSLGIKYIEDIDAQIRYIYLKVQEWINAKHSDYKADRGENWLSPQEAFDTYVTKKDVGDCEDTRALIYGCIVATLIQQERWEDNKKRLLCVDVVPTGAAGHAVLSWQKDNKVWALLESTFREDRFNDTWKGNKDIFKSVYCDIWHIFDHESEYKLVS